ncbi:MAG TPA: hypothetical protein PKC67_04905 [Kiritimatiellia bacterium]|nr:hypothetical protein [Kiritimatiellia bacterium]HMP33671.1 hypothetical protein [Kiritimatiellia bacterium]
MSVILNVVGVLVVLGATIGGGVMASQEGGSAFLGAVVGLVLGFLFMVVTCGLAFLVLEINNNLIRINEALRNPK